MRLKLLQSIKLFGIGWWLSAIVACSAPSSAVHLAQGKAAYAKQDYHTAFSDLYKAAQQGDATAQYAIGYMYYRGLGTVSNQSRALFWFNKAAQQHYAPAVEALATLDAHAQQEVL